MAINTQAKRRSVQAYTFGLVRTVATGSVNTLTARATESWLFAADAYPSPVAVADAARPLRKFHGPHNHYAGQAGKFGGRGTFTHFVSLFTLRRAI